MQLYYDFDEFGDVFMYDVEYSDVVAALREILSEMSKEELIEAIVDMECSQKPFEYFREELTQYFESDARYAYEGE